MWENFANNALFAGLMMLSGGRAGAAERAVVGETAAAANAERAAVANAETAAAGAAAEPVAIERQPVAPVAEDDGLHFVITDPDPAAHFTITDAEAAAAQPAVVNAPGYGRPVEIINPGTPFNPDASFTRANPPTPQENLSLQRGQQGVGTPHVPTVEMTDFKTPARTGSRATSRAASRTRTPAEAKEVKESETYIGGTNITTMRQLATTRGEAGKGISSTSTSTTSRQKKGRKKGKNITDNNTVLDGERLTEGVSGRTRGQQKKQSLASQVAEFFRNIRRKNSSGYTPIQSPQNTGSFVQMAEGSRYQGSPSLLS
jgi:hypothetical protein